MSSAERRNTWQSAEILGESTPFAYQQFLYRAPWDAEGLRDELERLVGESLGDEDAVLCVDETVFLKKGERSAGVQRQ